MSITDASATPDLASRVSGALVGTALASDESRGVEPLTRLGAESALQALTLDGLQDAAEWARQGTGADDVACLWLGALRWVRGVDGTVPDGAPEPPARPAESVLGDVADATGGDPQNLTGLRSPEMSSPRRPWNRPAASVPDLAATDGPGVLGRAAILGLLPGASDEDVKRLARSAAAFSHGSPAAHSAAEDAAVIAHRIQQGPWAVRAAIGEYLGRERPAGDNPGGAAAALRRAAETVGTVLSDLDQAPGAHPERAWEAVDCLSANGDEGAAIFAGAVIGALLGAERIPAPASATTGPVVGQLKRLGQDFAATVSGD